MNEITPMMKQYFEIKDKCLDCILFYRLGDFYEMFYDDAKTASKELELTLTGRDCGQEERAPMCGVPYHAAVSYISKLIEKGYKVAICEQTEDPALAKGIVKREIVRIITPGTLIESNILNEKINNFITSVYSDNGCYALTYADISTGLLKTTQILYGNTTEKLTDELCRISPSELLLDNNSKDDKKLLNAISQKLSVSITYIEAPENLDLSVNILKSLRYDSSLSDPIYEMSFISSAMLLSYFHETQKRTLDNLDLLEYYSIEEYMTLDSSTRRNLELTESIKDRTKKGSLLSIIDKTSTSMGGRLLRQFINQPLIDIEKINKRLDAVLELKDDYIQRMKLKDSISDIYDIERIISRASAGTISLRDMIALKNSLSKLPQIKELLIGTKSKLLSVLSLSIHEFPLLYDSINRAIVDEPPVNMKDGGYIKEGYIDEIDELIGIKKDGTLWLGKLEQEEREKTQIKNIKIKYNKVFGYFIEVTNSYSHLVPSHYIRKQTLANSERYITGELKTLEDKILGADLRLIRLEAAVYNDIKEKIKEHIIKLKQTAAAIAYIDVIISFSEVSSENKYCRPVMSVKDEIHIINGRHPVVEKLIDRGAFVSNDILLDLKEHRFNIITGPNMAGKSTFMRQTALIVLLSQIGCFVPADEAHIGLVDKIFTRVGASDDIGSGQSTFMVEMTEMANILNNATNRSLLILDEIGRGTSTFDGLSIAWAVTEYISRKENIGARTLFATHYHELTELEGRLPGVMNYRVKVLEQGDDVVFLRKIEKGGADESYGIHVAKLAGVPAKVIQRATAIANELKKADINKMKNRKKMTDSVEGQLDLINVFGRESEDRKLIDEFKKELMSVEISKTSPIEALNKLYWLQSKFLKEQ